jgi:ABC-type multidrug transport system ATPase subunit
MTSQNEHSESTEYVLRTFGLGKRFQTRWAVNNLNLLVRRGEIFGFLGPNGAGKSTTIRMMLSLVRPTAGSIELFGKSLHEQRRICLARVGGLVERADFYLYLSARRNLEIVGTLLGSVNHKDIDRVLDIVRLADRADDKVKTYSHGMKQRLGIAQALLGSPELVVLDEPTSGLDPQGIKEVRDLIKQLSAEHGMTVFLSSHILSEIEQTATSMAIINEGTLIVQGGVSDLLTASSGVVWIDAHPRDRAFQLLQQQGMVKEVREEGERLIVTVHPDQVAAVNRFLVNAGIEVRAITPKRSLEEYFLMLTGGASKISPGKERRGESSMEPEPLR